MASMAKPAAKLSYDSNGFNKKTSAATAARGARFGPKSDRISDGCQMSQKCDPGHRHSRQTTWLGRAQRRQIARRTTSLQSVSWFTYRSKARIYHAKHQTAQLGQCQVV
jgi:hypothetical protein